MTKQVKFYWWKSYKVWNVAGNTIEDITNKCHKLCEKYKAVHFEIL